MTIIPIQSTAICPKCKLKIEPYGEVTDAPILVQMQDMTNGVEREYISDRYFCYPCHHMFDIQRINRILS